MTKTDRRHLLLYIHKLSCDPFDGVTYAPGPSSLPNAGAILRHDSGVAGAPTLVDSMIGKKCLTL